jgi:hypothetical protein
MASRDDERQVPIPVDLHTELKVHAVKAGMSLKEVTTEAVRRYLKAEIGSNRKSA